MGKSPKYLVLNVKGLDFVETWFGAPKCVPPDLTKLYQLTLNMVTMKGMMLTYLALRAGYTIRLINEAVKKGYIELSPIPQKPSEEALRKIKAIIGEPRREMIV